MSAAFVKIWEATALYDYWADSRRNSVTDAEQWATHTVQAVAWNMLGEDDMGCSPVTHGLKVSQAAWTSPKLRTM